MYEMFLIFERPIKVRIPCESCCKKGFIYKKCPKCNGRGIHMKTYSIWKVKDKEITIDVIDRATTDSFYKLEIITKKGELRYWTDKSCYFSESKRLVHFTKKDAERECEQRNIEKYGVEFCNQII